MNKVETELLAQLDQAEWALRMLAVGQHKCLEKLLNRITSDFRVVKEVSALEKAHVTLGGEDNLHKQSSAIGTIRSSFVDGSIKFTVYALADSTDPQQAKLLSLSQRELLGAFFDAIGLSKKTKTKNIGCDGLF